MECKTKELILKLREDNIIETRLNENVKELTMEGVDENFEAIKKLDKLNDGPKGSLVIMAPFYIKKNVVKRYTTTDVIMPVGLGLVTSSFASRIMGNLFLTIRERFWAAKEDYPVKIFDQREDAIEWLKGYIEKAKNA